MKFIKKNILRITPKNLFTLVILVMTLKSTFVNGELPMDELEIFFESEHTKIWTDLVIVKTDMTWRVNGISDLLDKENVTVVYSTPYVTPLRDFHLLLDVSIVPKGLWDPVDRVVSEDDTYIKFHISCQSEKYPTVYVADYSLSLLDSKSQIPYSGAEYRPFNCSTKNERPWINYGRLNLTKEEITQDSNNIVENDTITLYADFDGFVSYEHESNECNFLTQSIPNNWFTSRMKNFSQNDLFSDAKVIVNGEKEFSAHKVVLVAGSKLLAAMLADYTRNTYTTAEVYLTDLDEEAVGDALDFMYSGQAKRLHERLWVIWKVAFKLEIAGLFELCNEMACQTLNLHNAMDMYARAEEYKVSWLLSRITRFLNLHMSETLANPQYPSYVALHSNKIKIWFQNRRTKWKRKYTNDVELLAQQYYSSLGIHAPRPIFVGDRLWFFNYPSHPQPGASLMPAHFSPLTISPTLPVIQPLPSNLPSGQQTAIFQNNSTSQANYSLSQRLDYRHQNS